MDPRNLMGFKFISTNNEKFAYAYTLEKALCHNKLVVINVYGSGGVEEYYCKKLGELRWLLKENRKEMERDIEFINERIKFKIIEDIKEFDESESVQFHLFPSKILPKMADYVKFLLKLNCQKFEECLLVDDIDIYKEKNFDDSSKQIRNWVYGMFPPDSIYTVMCHSASRQFEIQKLNDKGIVETIKMEWNNDKMSFS